MTAELDDSERETGARKNAIAAVDDEKTAHHIAQWGNQSGKMELRRRLRHSCWSIFSDADWQMYSERWAIKS